MFGQSNTSKTALRGSSETHGPNEISIYRKDEVAAECLPGSKTSRSGCPGPDGKPMTRAQLSAKRKECKNRGTVASRLITKYRFSEKTCKCEKTQGGIPETTEKIGEGVKDVYKCMKNGLLSKNGKPTKISCDAYGGGPTTSMGSMRKR